MSSCCCCQVCKWHVYQTNSLIWDRIGNVVAEGDVPRIGNVVAEGDVPSDRTCSCSRIIHLSLLGACIRRLPCMAAMFYLLSETQWSPFTAICCYACVLFSLAVKRNRVSVANGNADRNSVRFSQNLEQNLEASGSSSGDEYYSTAGSGVNVIESSVDPEPVIVTASTQEDDRSQEVGVVVSVVEETQPETNDEKDVEKSTGGSVTETVTEVAGEKPELEEEVNEQKEEVNEAEPKVVEVEQEVEQETKEPEQEVKEPKLEEPHTPLEVNVEIKSVTSQPEQEEAERETRENSAPISVSGIVTDESVS